MRRPKHASVTIAAVLGFAFLYIPIIVIVINAFNANRQLISWSGGTLTWFKAALQNDEFRHALVSSLEIGVVVGVLSVAIAFLNALARRRSNLPLGRLDDLSVILRMVLPEIVVVMGTFLAAHIFHLQLGLPLVIASEVVYCSAYAYLVVASRLRQLSEQYEAAASGPRRLRVLGLQTGHAPPGPAQHRGGVPASPSPSRLTACSARPSSAAPMSRLCRRW